MGYRSDVKIWFSKEAAATLKAEHLEDLKTWEYEGNGVFALYGWKWYEGYPQVQLWTEWMASAEPMTFDFIRIGEEVTDIEMTSCLAFKLEWSITSDYDFRNQDHWNASDRGEPFSKEGF